MTANNSEIRLDRLADGLISAIVIDRPAKRNAMSPAMLENIQAALDAAQADPSRVIIVHSAVPGVFSAGADISYLGTQDDARGEELLQHCAKMLQQSRKVTVAISDGLTIGAGLVIFLACDIRLAVPGAIFRMPPVRLARVYEFEGIARFVRIVGLTAATEMLLTARQYNLDEGLKCGLVSRVMPDSTQALAYCRQAAECPPQAQQAMKAMLYYLGKDLARTELKQSELDKLEEVIASAQGSQDSREALRAFHEKRPPLFVGK